MARYVLGDNNLIDPASHGEGPFTTLTSWAGWRFRLKAPTPQDGSNFRSWSDGGAAVHPVAPTGNVTYTAAFTRSIAAGVEPTWTSRAPHRRRTRLTTVRSATRVGS